MLICTVNAVWIHWKDLIYRAGILHSTRTTRSGNCLQQLLACFKSRYIYTYWTENVNERRGHVKTLIHALPCAEWRTYKLTMSDVRSSHSAPLFLARDTVRRAKLGSGSKVTNEHETPKNRRRCPGHPACTQAGRKHQHPNGRMSHSIYYVSSNKRPDGEKRTTSCASLSWPQGTGAPFYCAIINYANTTGSAVDTHCGTYNPKLTLLKHL